MKKQFFVYIFISLFLTSYIFSQTVYKVERGDTLYSISKKYQITVAELRTANNLKENDIIKVGQKLIIPDADISTAAALSTTNKKVTIDKNIKTENYQVQKGDTLYGIAKKNGISVAELMALNNLNSSSVIKVGQKLKLYKKELPSVTVNETTVSLSTNIPDTRSYGSTINSDSSTKWPVANPKVTQIKGKVWGVQLSAKTNEAVKCINEGTVMYVGIYRGFGQVVFVQNKTGLIYAYTGLGSVTVRKGEYVLSDAVLGTAGIDTLSKNSQITLMVFQNGQPIDPAKAPRS